MVKKALKEAAQPLYGAFEYKGKVVEFEQDGELRDNENVPLNPAVSTSDLIENYFKAEVLPHVNDAWINADKRDAKDGEVGIVGYEIPFNRHFYVYQPPRPLEEIDADRRGQRRDYEAAAGGTFLMAKYKAYPEYKDSGVEWLGRFLRIGLSLN